MKIELMGKKIEAGSKEQEEMKVGRAMVSGKQMAGIDALAEETYWELYDRSIDFGKEQVFRIYMGIVYCIADKNPALALDLICNLLKDNECKTVLAKVIAFIPREDEHIFCFVTHFCATLIQDVIAEAEAEWEDDDDDPEPEFVVDEFISLKN